MSATLVPEDGKTTTSAGNFPSLFLVATDFLIHLFVKFPVGFIDLPLKLAPFFSDLFRFVFSFGLSSQLLALFFQFFFQLYEFALKFNSGQYLSWMRMSPISRNLLEECGQSLGQLPRRSTPCFVRSIFCVRIKAYCPDERVDRSSAFCNEGEVLTFLKRVVCLGTLWLMSASDQPHKEEGLWERW